MGRFCHRATYVTNSAGAGGGGGGGESFLQVLIRQGLMYLCMLHLVQLGDTKQGVGGLMYNAKGGTT